MATHDEQEVSAELDLAGFSDPAAEETGRWDRLERDVLVLAEPLGRMLTHKHLCDRLDKSKGQLSRELSPHYESDLSLTTALCIGRETQNERMARIIVCDGLGLRMPEWQRPKITEADELRALKEELRESGAAGLAILEGAKRRARSRR